MDAATLRLAMIGGGAAVVGLVLWRTVGKAGELAGQAAAAVDTAVAAPVLGVGDILGIPRTNATECERAMAEGRTWDASFACPAGDFLAYLTRGAPAAPTGTKPATQPVADGSSIGGGTSFGEASSGGWDWTGTGWGIVER